MNFFVRPTVKEIAVLALAAGIKDFGSQKPFWVYVPAKIEKNPKTSLVKKFHQGHKYIPKTKGFDVAF